MAARILTSAAYGFAAIIALAICAGLGLTLTWAPYVAWRDMKSRVPTQESLKGGFRLRADKPLAEALSFAATGDWDARPDIDGAEYVKALSQAITDFMQIASEGHLHVLHKAYRNGVWDKVPATSWHTYRIDLIDVLRGEPVLKRRKDDTVVEGCHELTVCRAEWDARWDHYRSRLV